MACHWIVQQPAVRVDLILRPSVPQALAQRAWLLMSPLRALHTLHLYLALAKIECYDIREGFQIVTQAHFKQKQGVKSPTSSSDSEAASEVAVLIRLRAALLEDIANREFLIDDSEVEAPESPGN